MSKNKKGIDYSKVTSSLVKQVEKVLEEADKHTYSTMGVFSAYNAAYGLDDKPQTCSSCLRARVNLLRDWMKGYKAQLKEKTPPNPEYVQAYELQNGTGLYVEKGKEGTPLCFKDGVIVGDGEYTVKGEDGKDYAVLTLKEGLVVDSKYVQPEEVEPQYTDPDVPGKVQQVENTVRYLMAEGLPFDFSPNEGTLVKGTVKLADGSRIKPGTYLTAENLKIVVQPGGKANIREVEEDPNKDIDKAE